MKIKYSIGIKVPAGWRQVEIVAIAERISEKMAEITDIELIDGEEPSYKQSRTGANRQKFNGTWWAKTEIGKKKRISSCTVIED